MRMNMKPRRIVALALFWIVAIGAVILDWRHSTQHHRFAEPPPLALGNGPAADAGQCSLAPTR